MVRYHGHVFKYTYLYPFLVMPTWNGMAPGAAGDGLPPGMVMMPMMYPMMYPMAGSAPPSAQMANSKNP